MPIEIKAYRCQFKCGIRAKQSKKDMDVHEVACWNNPANRTCRTCMHEMYGHYGDDETEPRHWERNCKIKPGELLLDAAYESLKDQGVSYQIKPLTNCPHWEPEK